MKDASHGSRIVLNFDQVVLEPAYDLQQKGRPAILSSALVPRRGHAVFQPPALESPRAITSGASTSAARSKLIVNKRDPNESRTSMQELPLRRERSQKQ